MRTTINLSDQLVSQVMKESQSKTLTQAIRTALQEYLEGRKRQRLIASFGAYPNWKVNIRNLRKNRDLG